MLRTRASISRVTGQLNLVVDGMAISLILGHSQQSSPFFHIYIIIFFVLFFFSSYFESGLLFNMYEIISF